MTENAARFSSSDNLSHLAPLDVQTGSAHSPAVSDDNGEAISAGAIYNSAEHMAEYEFGDTVMHDSVVSSFGEAIPVSDIESTLGLLSDADVSLHQPQFGELSKDVSVLCGEYIILYIYTYIQSNSTLNLEGLVTVVN